MCTTSITIKNRQDEVRNVSLRLVKFSQKYGYNDLFTQQCDLAISEALNNVIKHAYPKNKSGEISVDFKQKYHRFICTIRDTGKQQDPNLFHQLPDVERPLLRESGFGLQIMHNVMDEINYRYDNENILTLIKII